VGMEVDTINITTLLRICGLDMGEGEAADYSIPGGILDTQEFARLLSLGQIEKIVDELVVNTPYREPLQRAMELLDKRGEIVFQDEMERYVIRSCLIISEDTLGIGVIIKYMWKKYLEAVNLRIIVRGKSIGLIESQIREELIVLD
jgi:vacuolar-type H+-ATPase subunit C/Vma6